MKSGASHDQSIQLVLTLTVVSFISGLSHPGNLSSTFLLSMDCTAYDHNYIFVLISLTK